MAIISCPRCGKKISDKSQSCQHCQSDLTGMSPEKIRSLALELHRKKIEGSMNQSMLALLLFLAGFCVLYFWEAEPGSSLMLICEAMIGVGFAWYIFSRTRIIYLKRKS